MRERRLAEELVVPEEGEGRQAYYTIGDSSATFTRFK